MTTPVIPWTTSRSDLNQMDRYNQQLARGLSFGFRKEDNVLDVGPMCFPFPHSTHRLGIDKRDDPQDGKPFVLADIQQRTPFEDKFFDFVYCSHVLEHLDDPIAAATEIARIGKRGYIEIPSGFCTMFLCYGEVHPKWFCYKDNENYLVFSPWNKKLLPYYSDNHIRWAMDLIVNGNVEELALTKRELMLRNFYYKNADLLDPYQLWTEEPKIKVIAGLFN